MPPDFLLGARTLKERDEILEVMVRHLAAKPGRDIEYHFRFLSFQGDRGPTIVHDHDPHQELLQRIHDLGLAMLPVSARKESRMEHGWRIESEQGEYGVEYSIVYIEVAKDDSVEVGVNEMPGFCQGGQRFTYTIKRSNGQWTVASEKAGPGF